MTVKLPNLEGPDEFGNYKLTFPNSYSRKATLEEVLLFQILSRLEGIEIGIDAVNGYTRV